jgi:cell wall-associated NlpC family hydrolase
MHGTHRIRQLVGATLLASGVLAFSKGQVEPLERPPVSRIAGHARTPVPARPFKAVQDFERYQLALRDSIVRLTLAQVGTPYEFGGTSPDGFDCSGLIRYVFSRLYLTPPRTARQQARIGAPIQRNRLRPGDILTFGKGDSVTHIGIYVGDRRFVHASSVAGRVIVSHVDRPPSELIRPLKGARRLLAISDPFEHRFGGD